MLIKVIISLEMRQIKSEMMNGKGIGNQKHEGLFTLVLHNSILKI